VNYIVLVEGKPTLFHMSRLLPYDPTGVQTRSPLHIRLEHLKKELSAYEALVHAESKTLQSRKRRLVEESKGEVITEDEPQPELKHIDLEVGAHPTEYEISGMEKTPSEQDSISSESKMETLNAGPATEGLPPVGLPEPSVPKGLEKGGPTASTQPSSDRIPTPGTITSVVRARKKVRLMNHRLIDREGS
jgi:hypothetical protein